MHVGRVTKYLLYISLSFLLSCTNGVPEIQLSTSTADLEFSFDSKDSYKITTLPSCSQAITVSGKCDKRLSNILFSLDSGTTWSDSLANTSSNDVNCSDGAFQLTFENICSSFGINANESGNKEILVKGKSIAGDTSVKSVKVIFDNLSSTPPTISITAPSTTVEGGTASFTVQLDKAGTSVITVQASTSSGTAIASSDFASTSMSVTFNPGETTKTFNVLTSSDSIFEIGDESFTASLTSPVNATIALATATALISNATPNPTISASPASQSVNENVAGGIANITISTDFVATQDMVISFSVAGTATGSGTDYTISGSTATIIAGSNSVTLPVSLVDDSVGEGPDETVIVTLNAETNGYGNIHGVNNVHTLTIVDNETLNLSISDTSATEGNNLTFTLTLSNPKDGATSINWNTSGGTAVPGIDYFSGSGTAVIPSGSTSITVTVIVPLDGILCEVNKTMFVNLTAATAGVTITDNQATGTIVDPERPSISVNDISINEEDGVANVSVSLSQICAAFSVPYDFTTITGSAISPGDFTSTTGTTAVPAGSMNWSVPVAIINDSLDEFSEAFNLVISNAGNSAIIDNTGIVTILDEDPEPTLSIDSPGAVTELNSITFTVTLSQASEKPVTVSFATVDWTALSSSDYLSSSNTLTFTAGETSKTIVISTVGDTVSEAVETFSVNLGSATNALISTAVGTGTINDDDLPPAPSSVLLEVPLTSPNVSWTPTFRVNGLVTNDTVRIFDNSICTNEIGSGISGGASEVISLAAPLTTDGLYKVYATRQPAGGGLASSCSLVYGIYHLLRLNVAPVYTNASNWNSYIRNNGADVYSAPDIPANVCDGTESGTYSSCIHGGEKRKVLALGFADCVGLELYDNLDAFDWNCQSTQGGVVFHSKGLNPGKGLSSLMTFAGWNSFFVTLSYRGKPLVTSIPSNTVWGNTIQTIGNSSSTYVANAQGVIYTTSSDVSRGGFNFAADRTSLVIPKGYNFKIASGTTNCSVFSDTGSYRCLVFATNKKFLWIEGSFDGDNSTALTDFGIRLTNVKMSRLNNINSYYSKNVGIYLMNSDKNLLSGLRLAYHNDNLGFHGGALMLDTSHFNVVHDVIASQNNYSLNRTDLAGAINLKSSSNNIFTKIFAVNNYINGIKLHTGSNNNVFSNVSTISNDGFGIQVDASDYNSLNNILAGNNFDAGIQLNSSIATSISYALSRQNRGSGYGISDINSVGSLYLFRGIFDTCSTSGVLAGIDASCNSIGGSTSINSTGSPLTSSTFSGVASDIVNPINSQTVTASNLNTTAEYVGFQNSYRAWQKGISFFTTLGFCQSTDLCGAFDYSLNVADTTVKRFNAYHSAFSPGGGCPASVDGSNAVSAAGTSYLANANEIMFDSSGDDDGLCESNEVCEYAPNPGGFQNFNKPMKNQTCIFNNGTVSGVKMLGAYYAHFENDYALSGLGLTQLNLAVRKNSSGYDSAAKANIPKTSGKWYFEVKIINPGFASLQFSHIGIGSTGAAFNTFVGGGGGANVSYGYSGYDGMFYSLGTPSATSFLTFTHGDIISVAVDLDSDKIWFGKNGVWSGDPANGLSAAFSINGSLNYYPMISIKGDGGNTIEYSANFGQYPFKSEVPFGFNIGWY